MYTCFTCVYFPTHLNGDICEWIKRTQIIQKHIAVKYDSQDREHCKRRKWGTKRLPWFFKKILFVYIFLETGEGREKERERNINVWLSLTCLPVQTWPATKACALTGNQTSNLLVCRLALNLLSHISQGEVLDCYQLHTYIYSYWILENTGLSTWLGLIHPVA